jgi:hypothetical protein
MTDEMEMDQNAYEQMEGMEMEEEEADDGELNFDSLRNVIEKSEDKSKDQIGQAREANYISKGTYIWQLLN